MRPGGTGFNIFPSAIKVHTLGKLSMVHVCLPFERGTTLKETSLLLLYEICYLRVDPI